MAVGEHSLGHLLSIARQQTDEVSGDPPSEIPDNIGNPLTIMQIPSKETPTNKDEIQELVQKWPTLMWIGDDKFRELRCAFCHCNSYIAKDGINFYANINSLIGHIKNVHKDKIAEGQTVNYLWIRNNCHYNYWTLAKVRDANFRIPQVPYVSEVIANLSKRLSDEEDESLSFI